MEKNCSTCRFDCLVWKGAMTDPARRCDECNGAPGEFPGWEAIGTAEQSDGSTASYYELPPEAQELQDIIAFLNCNAQMGEIGRAWMRYGRCPHSPRIRDIKKIIFYAQAELERLEKYEEE